MTIRQTWKNLFRLARIVHKSKPADRSALCYLQGLEYRALITVEHRADSDRDFREGTTPADRLAQNKLAKDIIDEILAERKAP